MKTTSRFNLFALKRTVLFRSVGLILFGVAMAGCSPTAKPDQKVVLRGSNTFGEELGPQLVAEYRKVHPDVDFDLEFKATSYGIGALMVSKCDIAAASREVTTNEVTMAKSNGVEFNEYSIGSYSVAVIVNSSNPVANLTKDQVRDIFTGTIQNWKDVGGPDAPIQLYIRDPISGTYLGFRELAMENKPYALGLKGFTSYKAVADAVAKDPNGIGFSTIELPTKSGVKAVSVEGVAPNSASVNEGKYPYVRVLRLYTDKANESAKAHDFIQFIVSPPGQQILSQTGFVPRS